MEDLSNRVAIVTGANRGIGRAIAIALATAGVDIAVNYNSHAGEADEVCDQVSSLGRRAIAVRADVSIADDVANLVETTEQELGDISILVNNAGISRVQQLDQVTETDFDDLIRVNLKSVFLMSQAVVPGMRSRRWGRIINISSVAAQTGGVIGPHYAASKAGMHGLTHSYAALLAKEGVTANAIAPALVETAMIENLPPAAKDRIPVGRYGKVEEVGDVALMLARNGYITGQTINVNGGWYMS